jgi:hypothetical protein
MYYEKMSIFVGMCEKKRIFFDYEKARGKGCE